MLLQCNALAVVAMFSMCLLLLLNTCTDTTASCAACAAAAVAAAAAAAEQWPGCCCVQALHLPFLSTRPAVQLLLLFSLLNTSHCRRYKYFIFLNSSIKGPFVPNYMPPGWQWTQVGMRQRAGGRSAWPLNCCRCCCRKQNVLLLLLLLGAQCAGAAAARL